MPNYTVKYAHEPSGIAGQLDIPAADDAGVMDEMKKFVRSGYRNGTWATTELSDGRTFAVRNVHGEVVASATQHGPYERE